jgi:hypothetical protein
MKKTILLLTLLSTLIISCNSNSYQEEDQIQGLALSYSSGDDKYDNFVGNAYYGYTANVANKLEERQNPAIERKLVKNGNITFETPDLKVTKTRVNELVKKYSGYISKDSENERNNRMNVHLTIRVPAKSFDSLLNDISKGVEKFDYKQVKIDDVTEEFVDIQSRLKNKKELEQRYLQILKKAKNVKEILEVEKEIGKLREEIESAEGRLKYLKDQVAVSTLEVSFYKEFEGKTTGFGQKINDSFGDGFTGLTSLFLFLISIWPYLIIGVVILLWIRRRLKRKNKS